VGAVRPGGRGFSNKTSERTDASLNHVARRFLLMNRSKGGRIRSEPIRPSSRVSEKILSATLFHGGADSFCASITIFVLLSMPAANN